MQSIKPGRGPSFMGGFGSLIAVAFGIVWTVLAFEITRNAPFPIVKWAFPLFGMIFVISGLISAAYHFFNATTKKRLSLIDVTTSKEEPDPLNKHFGSSSQEGEAIETRLAKLDDLKRKNLISNAEFAEQRHRILENI